MDTRKSIFEELCNMTPAEMSQLLEDDDISPIENAEVTIKQEVLTPSDDNSTEPSEAFEIDMLPFDIDYNQIDILEKTELSNRSLQIEPKNFLINVEQKPLTCPVLRNNTTEHSSSKRVRTHEPYFENNEFRKFFEPSCSQNQTTSSIEQENPYKFPLTFNHTNGLDSTLIPSSVMQLYEVIKEEYSDFAFVYALSAQLCQERIPMECLTNLKMSLLLSLASINGNCDRDPIPIVAVGEDTSMMEYLMNDIGQLAMRFMGPTDYVKSGSIKSDRNTKWIEADPVLLAKDGVFYIGDWSHLKQTRADKLFKDIECARVTLENTTQDYPLQTAIWTHWRSFKCTKRDQQTFNKFVKIFGIPIAVNDGKHESLVDFILDQSSVRIFESTFDHLSITSDHMRNFLAVISKRTVDFSKEATELLQRYFVVSRIERSDCLTKQAFAMLRKFAESFTKLSMRHEVLEVDAVAAIYMCEYFIHSFYGAGDAANPPPIVQSHNFVGKVDENIKEFQIWLNKYIERHYNKEKD